MDPLVLTNSLRSDMTNETIKNVIVHPLVLLSVVDHYTRVAKNTKKRVVGVLLGGVSEGVVNISNSYARTFGRGDLKKINSDLSSF